MTKYYVPLTQEEELNLKQLAAQPGFPALFKLLQIESLDAQAVAMECKGNSEARLLALSDAQAMKDAVGKLTQRLASYRESLLPHPEPAETGDPFDFSMFNGREN